jgi:two-component system, NarL family, sensor kinase
MSEPARTDDAADRLFGYLRLGAVPLLIAGGLFVAHPRTDNDFFFIAVGSFAVYAVLAIGLAGRAPGWILTATDLCFAGILSFTSGGAFSQLRFAFVFAPLASAFRRRPALTLAASLAAAGIYLGQALAHPSRTLRADAISFAVIQAAFLLWIGLVATILSLLLARHERGLERLLVARQLLVAEAMVTEERERKRLAEVIHDDAIQHLLAARLDIAAAQVSGDPVDLDRADEAVAETVERLRRTMSELHPHLLERISLEAALRSAGERAAARAGFTLELTCTVRPAGGNEAVLLRCGSELLTNAAKHARASRVRVEAATVGGEDRMTVQDDGVGFDPTVLDARIAAGHIGLLSLRERAEALGGRLELTSGQGRGTRVVLAVPRRLHAADAPPPEPAVAGPA